MFYPFENNGILLYVEKFNFSSNYVLVDFVDSNEFTSFSSSTGIGYDWAGKPTMIEIVNYNQKRLREGTTYVLTNEAIDIISQRIEVTDDSLVIGFRIDLANEQQPIFGNSKSFNDFEKHWRRIDLSLSRFPQQFDFNSGLLDKVTVRNIGQGNWNEVISADKTKVVFDAGTIYTTKRAKLLELIGNRDEDYQVSKPLLILSHWDVDHYHFLLGFHDDTIKAFSHFICRGILPNLTARKVYSKFKRLNEKALIPIAPEPCEPERSSKKLTRYHLSNNRQLVFFNAAKNASRNRSGLGLILRTSKDAVIFSGDYDYAQISDYMLPELNYSCNHYLIVTHHGGKAGKFTYNHHKSNKLKSAIISVGKNPYKPPHPHSDNISNLDKIGFKVERTDRFSGDYNILL
ncbi:hypothetical protein GCM10027443_22830 [Pontibacter brevis]